MDSQGVFFTIVTSLDRAGRYDGIYRDLKVAIVRDFTVLFISWYVNIPG